MIKKLKWNLFFRQINNAMVKTGSVKKNKEFLKKVFFLNLKHVAYLRNKIFNEII